MVKEWVITQTSVVTDERMDSPTITNMIPATIAEKPAQRMTFETVGFIVRTFSCVGACPL